MPMRAGTPAAERRTRPRSLCLYITLSETKDELDQVAETHGWNLAGIDLFELIPAELSLDPEQQQSVIHSSDLELGETIKMAFDEVHATDSHRSDCVRPGDGPARPRIHRQSCKAWRQHHRVHEFRISHGRQVAADAQAACTGG